MVDKEGLKNMTKKITFYNETCPAVSSISYLPMLREGWCLTQSWVRTHSSRSCIENTTNLATHDEHHKQRKMKCA